MICNCRNMLIPIFLGLFILCNGKKLYVDDDAVLAEKWLESCPTSAPSMIHPDYQGKSVIYTSLGVGRFSTYGMMRLWGDGSLVYDYDTNKCKKSTDACEKWKLVIRAEVQTIGCAHVECAREDKSSETVALCVYTPEMMNKAERPYEKGTPCSQCRLLYTKCEGNLCASPLSASGSRVQISMLIPMGLFALLCWSITTH